MQGLAKPTAQWERKNGISFAREGGSTRTASDQTGLQFQGFGKQLGSTSQSMVSENTTIAPSLV